MSAAHTREANAGPVTSSGSHARGGGTPALRSLCLVIGALESGGAERVLSMLASQWAEQGRDVSLVTLYPATLDYYPLHPRVRRVALNLASESRGWWSAARNNLVRVRALRAEICARRPGAVVSFTSETNVLTLLATRGLGVPTVVSERTDPTMQPLGRMWERLRRMLYPWADALVVQTEEVRRWAAAFMDVGRVQVVPNPVMVPDVAGDDADGLPQLPSGPLVVGMGRLSPEKGFDVLLHAFARARAANPGWTLVLLGEGSERARLEELAREVGMEDAVRMPGRVRRPDAVLRRAEMFVLSSRYEGFPNALMEAMVLGLPVVSTDCPSGPRNIVRDGVDGVLVPPEDAAALAGAMGRLMQDPHERARLGRSAREVGPRFSPARVMATWDDVLAQARARHG